LSSNSNPTKLKKKKKKTFKIKQLKPITSTKFILVFLNAGLIKSLEVANDQTLPKHSVSFSK
jgi:hypothetical protein